MQKYRQSHLQNNFSADTAPPTIKNDRHVVFQLTREIVNAQFFLADQELTKRLWQDVAEREIDVERIINLMYGCICHDDDAAMLEADLCYEKSAK